MWKICDMRTLLKYAKNVAISEICGLPNFSSSLFCLTTKAHLSNSFQVLDDPNASSDCIDKSHSMIGSPVIVITEET